VTISSSSKYDVRKLSKTSTRKRKSKHRLTIRDAPHSPGVLRRKPSSSGM